MSAHLVIQEATVKKIPQKLQTLIDKGLVGTTDSAGKEFWMRVLDHQTSEILLLIQDVDGQTGTRVHITLNILCEISKMTTTVLELLENLKHYPGVTKLHIRDVDDVEFAIVDYQPGTDGLTIVIGEKVESDDEEEGG
ncbi:hypothetical protein CDG77_13975 [Nostoc sp. 'Peltigera membranacea cyanobiont' 213]|uniref:hypothetical protein n=1 Tax=Nostoc sp. 'Peltigera membranacea cyanobiont' 213 TaxID=2014530 RepID=UPI000B958A01|nr:hypothetical protein [Nostoc sp. 'Peltigera membranacea cyanobiont' 213]OYD92758.1 hypothetical protein CDG77_13975 [Nostoc sp. 'Peltigera membranacea cyanobiont' 213]